MSRSDMIVVLTALDVEYNAVRDHLRDIEQDRHDTGTRFEIGTVEGTRCRVALGLTGVGNHSSGTLTERAIRQYAPVAVIFVGVAGALWDSTALGDVVVAERVYAYHGGTSESDGFKARPRSWETSHGVSQLAHLLKRSGTWTKRLQPSSSGVPQVHFGAIAAGEIVQNSRISHEARVIRDHYNDATAIEMEAAGVAQAGHLNSAPVAIVRGISDRADGSKNSENDGTWQPRAAANSAAFAVELAALLVDEAGKASMSSNKNSVEIPAGSVFNTASGTVGLQAGHITGSTIRVAVGPQGGAAADPVAVEALAELRALIERRRAEGGVDEETYDVARTQLDTAETMLREAGPSGLKKTVMVLKALRAALSDVVDVAGKIGAVITTLNGLV